MKHALPLYLLAALTVAKDAKRIWNAVGGLSPGSEPPAEPGARLGISAGSA